MKSGHTEDGILFNFTLAKYIDGSVEVIAASCVPTWTYMEGYQERYTILPLDYSQVDTWQETFQVDDETYAACMDSYQRTMELVGEGLEKAQAHFDAVHEAKAEILSDPNWTPEPATEPTQVTETVPGSVPAEGETTAPTDETTVPAEGETTAPTGETGTTE